jgi:hypothetical protein
LFLTCCFPSFHVGSFRVSLLGFSILVFFPSAHLFFLNEHLCGIFVRTTIEATLAQMRTALLRRLRAASTVSLIVRRMASTQAVALLQQKLAEK